MFAFDLKIFGALKTTLQSPGKVADFTVNKRSNIIDRSGIDMFNKGATINYQK